MDANAFGGLFSTEGEGSGPEFRVNCLYFPVTGANEKGRIEVLVEGAVGEVGRISRS